MTWQEAPREAVAQMLQETAEASIDFSIGRLYVGPAGFRRIGEKILTGEMRVVLDGNGARVRYSAARRELVLSRDFPFHDFRARGRIIFEIVHAMLDVITRSSPNVWDGEALAHLAEAIYCFRHAGTIHEIFSDESEKPESIQAQTLSLLRRYELWRRRSIIIPSHGVEGLRRAIQDELTRSSEPAVSGL